MIDNQNNEKLIQEVKKLNNLIDSIITCVLVVGVFYFFPRLADVVILFYCFYIAFKIIPPLFKWLIKTGIPKTVLFIKNNMLFFILGTIGPYLYLSWQCGTITWVRYFSEIATLGLTKNPWSLLFSYLMTTIALKECWKDFKVNRIVHRTLKSNI